MTSGPSPGWWQASDGRWYPPETHPGLIGTPGSAWPTVQGARGSEPWNAPAQRASGFATASLILSIVWLGDLGSVLGVIFGALSLSEIRRSADRVTGGGMATAGVVIGAVGVLFTILLAIAVPLAVETFENITQPVTLTIGEAAVPNVGPTAQGIASVTVQAFHDPANPNISVGGRSVVPPVGSAFAVAEVRICAGPSGSTDGVATVRANLALTRVGQPSIYPAGDAVAPNLDRFSTLEANTCRSGYVTLVVRAGLRPRAVTWVAGPLQHTFNWLVGHELRLRTVRARPPATEPSAGTAVRRSAPRGR